MRVEIFLLQPFRNFSKRHQVPLHSFFRGWRGWKRGEAGWKQGDSILRLFRFFQLFFFFPSQLFNDERASRCLSSAAHKSCAKLARRTHLPCFFLSPRRDSALRGNPRYLGRLGSKAVNFNTVVLHSVFTVGPRFTILFHAQG